MNRWLKGVECELETNLVVAFACAAVGDELAAFLLGDLDLRASDDGACEGCAEQVDILVCSVALDCWEAELADKFVNDIFN